MTSCLLLGFVITGTHRQSILCQICHQSTLQQTIVKKKNKQTLYTKVKKNLLF